VLFVAWYALDGVQGIEAINHLSEDCIIVVQMRMLRVCKEELRSIRVRARVSHRQNASGGVLVVWMNLISELGAPYAGAAFPCVRRITALQHEALDVAMEERIVVIARARQRKKIKCRPRHIVTEDLYRRNRRAS